MQRVAEVRRVEQQPSVGFWLKQLQAGQSRCVAAQADRGTCSLTPEELSTFCKKQGSLTGLGFDELVERMKFMIPWDDKPQRSDHHNFQTDQGLCIIVTPEGLRSGLEAADAGLHFTDAEMLTAVGHLENYGYVKRLRILKGEQRVLLQPERLNDLASSFVLEARRNPKGLGALEEKRLLAAAMIFQN